MRARRKGPALAILAGSAVLLYVAYEKHAETVPGPAAERIALGVADAWFARLDRGDMRGAVDELWRSHDRREIGAWLTARSACLGKSVSRQVVGQESSQYAAGQPLVRLRFHSRYERGPAVREVIGVLRAPGGWGVASYYLEQPTAAERASPAMHELEKCFEVKRAA